MTRPQFDAPANLPEALRQKMIEASKRKWLWVAPDGATFFINEERVARNSAASQGGEVFPPEVAE